MKQSRSVVLSLFFLSFFLITAPAFARDIIKLKDGTVLEGAIVAQNTDGTSLLVGFGNKAEPKWISFGQIQSIRFGEVPVTAQPIEAEGAEQTTNG